MIQKLSALFIITLVMVAFLAAGTLGMSKADKDKWTNHNRVAPGTMPKAKIAGAERGTGSVSTQSGGFENLGFYEMPSLSPGLVVGFTTYDYQHNGSMTRHVDWRASEQIHFTWMKKLDEIYGESRGTAYNIWDCVDAQLVHNETGGGCALHPYPDANNRSGYVALDVDTEGKVVIANHHDEGAGYQTELWYDFAPGACYWSPYRDKLPDTCAILSLEECNWHPDEYELIWPDVDYQIWDGDTVTHVFSQQSREGIKPQAIVYFRRMGSDTVGYWECPGKCVDTVSDIAQLVTASRVNAKVALVWIANMPEYEEEGLPYPWNESGNSGSQRENDVFCMISENMGATFGPKINITKNHPDSASWHAHTDMSCLIGSDTALHVIWDAREWDPATQNWPHFYGCRLFHWDDKTEEIRVVSDANWDLPDMNYCTGGAWNEMSIVKMTISECDGKFYALYTQYNDVYNGIEDDCHEDTWTGGQSSTANGELYLAVSDNGGYNWDIARNLTNSYTPHCEEGVLECDSDMWASMSRFGGQLVDCDFTGVPVVDPSEGEYANPDDYYLDVFYVNDKYPGGAVQDAGVWTYNPLKWFRVPCVPPVPNPVISFSPKELADPTNTAPGIPKDTTIKVENIGNAPLTVYSITVAELTGPSGWLNVNPNEDINISHLSPNYAEVTVTLNQGGVINATSTPPSPTAVQGYLICESDSKGGTPETPAVDTFSVYLIVADHVEFPKWADISTACTRIIFNNAGNIGKGGNPPDGDYNLDFFTPPECDTTDNRSGSDDNANVYIYSMSPFILRVTDAGDTVMNSYIFDADWLEYDGLRPLDSIDINTGNADYDYAHVRKFCTKDSAIAGEIEYYAPKTLDPRDCKFIVARQIYYSYDGNDHDSVYFGEFMDWDIPSDSGVENGSGYDAGGGVASRDLMYCYGAEYGLDSIINNDCVMADMRAAGLAFYNGVKVPFRNDEDSVQNPAGPWWTHLNEDWVSPTGGFVASQIYSQINTLTDPFTAWEPTSGGLDSAYQDLHMVSVFGKFDLGADDTLYFVKILATEMIGGSDSLISTIDRAREWIGAHPEIWTWPPRITTCCDLPGDANNNPPVNILDITYLINFLYKGGPAPPCGPEGDANGNCVINILDITYLINFLYKGGPAPICGTCPDLE